MYANKNRFTGRKNHFSWTVSMHISFSGSAIRFCQNLNKTIRFFTPCILQSALSQSATCPTSARVPLGPRVNRMFQQDSGSLEWVALCDHSYDTSQSWQLFEKCQMTLTVSRRARAHTWKNINQIKAHISSSGHSDCGMQWVWLRCTWANTPEDPFQSGWFCMQAVKLSATSSLYCSSAGSWFIVAPLFSSSRIPKQQSVSLRSSGIGEGRGWRRCQHVVIQKMSLFPGKCLQCPDQDLQFHSKWSPKWTMCKRLEELCK